MQEKDKYVKIKNYVFFFLPDFKHKIVSHNFILRLTTLSML